MTLSWSCYKYKCTVSFLTFLECGKSWENGFKLRKINIFLVVQGSLTLHTYILWEDQVLGQTHNPRDEHCSMMESLSRHSTVPPQWWAQSLRKGGEGKNSLPLNSQAKEENLSKLTVEAQRVERPSSLNVQDVFNLHSALNDSPIGTLLCQGDTLSLSLMSAGKSFLTPELYYRNWARKL